MFKHYVLTRFNDGLYGPRPRVQTPPDEWMDHRLGLFAAFTVPSMMEQTCQEFTWLVLMDARTPRRYVEEIESFRYRNLKLIHATETGPKWNQAIVPGDYDLLTTRLDNDDAFHRDTIATLQETYHTERHRRDKPWVIVFPFGLIMDLARQTIWVMEYWLNNSPTRIGAAGDGQTAFQWNHDAIPREVGKCYVTDKPYWLQLVHAHNVLNAIPPQDHPNKRLHQQIATSLQCLTEFGVSPDRLPVA